MELTKLAAKPQLVKVAIDDADTIREFGEPLEFYIWDRQSIEKFVKLATLDYQDFGAVADIVQEYVLDSEGRPIVTNDSVLPSNILMRAITKVIDTLGKSVNTPAEKTAENTNQS